MRTRAAAAPAAVLAVDRMEERPGSQGSAASAGTAGQDLAFEDKSSTLTIFDPSIEQDAARLIRKEIVRLLEVCGGDPERVISTILDDAFLPLPDLPLTVVPSSSSHRKRPMSVALDDEEGAGNKRRVPEADDGLVGLVAQPEVPLPQDEAALAPPTVNDEDALIGHATSVRELPASFWTALGETFAGHHQNSTHQGSLNPKLDDKPDAIYDVLIDKTCGWRRAKLAKPCLSLYSNESSPTRFANGGLSVPIDSLHSTLEEMVQHSYMAESSAEALKAAVDADRATLQSLSPRRWDIMYVKFMVHDLTFTWPPEVAGQTFRMASPATISERGAQKGAKVCYELKSTGTDPEYIQRREQEWLAGRPERRERRRQDYTARRAYHRRLQHERARYYRDLDGSDDESSGDEDEDYEGYESSTPTEQALLNSDHTLHRQDCCSLVPPPDVVLNLALSSLAIEPHLVNIHPHLVRTIAEPLGSFEVHLPLKPSRAGFDASIRALNADPEAWVRQLSSPVGALCDEVLDPSRSYYDSGQEKMRNERKRINRSDEFDACVSKDPNADQLRTLLSQPLQFAWTVELLSSATRKLHCRVAVSLRPLAFIAGNQHSTLHMDQLTALLRRLAAPAPRLICQRSEASIFIEEAEDLQQLERKKRSGAKRGDLASRILASLQDISAVALGEFEESESSASPAPPGLRLELRPFQQHTLEWLLARERAPPGDIVEIKAQSGQPLWHGRGMFHLWPPVRGGFVMQDMGMGKTVEMLSLILANPRPADQPGTLALCPVSLLANWKTECDRVLPPSVAVLILNSANKGKTKPEDLGNYDLVISAYSLLKNSPVGKVRWWRLILDESAELKGSNTAKTTEVKAIRAARRWALSGTPMPNGPADLDGQVAALQMAPYDTTRIFNARLNPLSNGLWVDGAKYARASADASPQPLLKFLAISSIRHSKDSLSSADGEALVKLPPMSVEERMLDASPDEAEAYAELHGIAKERVALFRRGGAFGLRLPQLKNLFLRLRLASDHPLLAKDGLARFKEEQEKARALASTSGVEESTVEAVLADAKAKGPAKKHTWLQELLAPYGAEALCGPCEPDEGSGAEGGGASGVGASVGLPACAICMDEMMTPTLTSCEMPHCFCLSCLLEIMKESSGEAEGPCPVCRAQVLKSELLTLKLSMPAASEMEVGAEAGEADTSHLYSTKLDALMEVLRADTEAHPKTIIFTHFGAMQSKVSARLLHEGVSFVEIRPGASQAQRTNALRAFNEDAEVKVFILAMKASAVGLTLTSASRVIIVEPGTCLASEAQAIARVHRFGQSRAVHVVKLVMRATVEERISQEIHHTDAAAEEVDEPPAEASSSSSSSPLPSAAGSSKRNASAAKKPAQQTLSAELISRLLD